MGDDVFKLPGLPVCRVSALRGKVVETNVFALSKHWPCCFWRSCFQLIVG